MGRLISVEVAQLEPQVRVPRRLPVFTPSGTVSYYFQPGEAGLLTSAEGCNQQAGAPSGGLATTRGTQTCQSGNMGYATNYGAEGTGGTPASFVSAPLAAPLTIGGVATFKFYLVDSLQPAWIATSNPRITIEVDAIDADGFLVAPVASIEQTLCDASGNCLSGPEPVGGIYTMSLPEQTLPAGTRLAVSVRITSLVTSTSRALYGGRASLGADFSDAGLTLTTGTFQ
jgi:hypothetical protein